MKLRKIAEELDAVPSEAERQGRATFEVLERLFAMEYAALVQRRIERRIKDSGDYLGDPVITASLVDRMVHHAVIINMEGPS